MNRDVIIGVIVLLLVLAGFFYLSGRPAVSGLTTYTSEELGFAFDYRAGERGYTIQEFLGATTTDLVKVLVLMRVEDGQNIPVGGEGPPTITMFIVKNPEKLWPQTWADRNVQLSNINLKTSDPAETSVGGAKAIRYSADGLYPSDNVVITHGENVYVISGMYLEEDSEIRRDFQPLLDSIRFIRQPGQE